MWELTDTNCIRTDVNNPELQNLRDDAFSSDHIIALSAFMNAAGNETRLRLLYVLWKAEELCVCDLSDICGISQPAVSRHLKKLREKALVEARRDAQTIYYSVYLENPFSKMLLNLFEEQALSGISLTVNTSRISEN